MYNVFVTPSGYSHNLESHLHSFGGFLVVAMMYNIVMTSDLEYFGLNTSSDPFDDLWEATHPKGTASWEEEDDIPEYDSEKEDE